MRLLLPLLALLLVAAAPPLPSQLNDPNTNEGWIWQQAQAGKTADLNDRCGTEPLDIRKPDDARWQAGCRRVDPALLRALLTQPDLADSTPHGVRITGARIDGDLDLDDAHVAAAEVSLFGDLIAGSVIVSDARLDGPVQLDRSLIEGQIDSSYATFRSRLTLNGSIVRKGISGDSMRVHNSVALDAADIDGPVDLHDADIGGGLSMEAASIATGRPFTADRLHIGAGGLLLNSVRFGGSVDLNDARIDGSMSLWRASVANNQPFDAYGLHVRGGLSMNNAVFGGFVALRNADIDGQLTMVGAKIAADQMFDAGRMRVGTGGLFVSSVQFGGPVDLRDVQVDGNMDMEGVSVADGQPFDAYRMRVGTGGLHLTNARFGGPVNLRDTQVDGQMDMTGASVAGKQPFDADRLHIGAGGLFLTNVQFGGPINMRAARIDGTFTMDGAEVAKGQTFDAGGLHVSAGDLILSQVRFGGPVELGAARVDGRMFMLDANVASDQSFVAEEFHVGRDMFLRGTTFGGPVDFLTMSVDGGLDLRNTHLRQLTMEGAVVGTEFVLGGLYGADEQWLRWDACDGPAPCLNVRNLKVGNLQDDERAWPSRITLEGFSYAHLGGIGGEQHLDMRSRPIDWWRDWLNRDPVYSAQPYAQLAAVLAAAGNREGAADVRFFGRDRERTEQLRGCAWLQELDLVDKPEDARPCRWGVGLALSTLQAVVGYGIGNYSFRAVACALALALAGTAILCLAPGVRGVRPSRMATRRGPRQKSLLWCFGASLHQVLPVVTISEEFSAFFNDPGRERLHAWQHVAFGALALCGWALALFVAAAFSGLIQN